MHIRYPGWANMGIEIKVNNIKFVHNSVPGSYITMTENGKKEIL